MRVFYDGVIYKLQKYGGINRYFNNLISRLPDEITPILTAYRAKDIAYPKHPNLKTYRFLGRENRPRRLFEALERRYFESVTSSASFDLMHPTYYWMLTGKDMTSYRRPLVVTVHDMIHELYADRMDSNGQIARTKRRSVEIADAVICVSENTKKDLMKLSGVREDKITVIYLSSELDIRSSYGDEPVPKRPYFLYVGSRNPNYKNFDRLLEALSKVVTRYPEVILCSVGGSFRDFERQQISDLGIENHLETLQNPSDSHLAKLYRCSVAFVYPSNYEGFGIPPLEAMACGTPVIASNRSSIPEVVGDGGIQFDPNSVADLADAMLSVLENPIQRDRWIERGFDRVQQFSWQKTADRTLEVYKQLVVS
ncbi:MAG: glycosyltransferase family 4 protein [Cyanobacteria bacterium SID2]|nr:glycosyltransferase family 4 protein [Cyanobacteria bacterium SID2]MBP0005163.1 glycosyltransferase family 4 protein [Cyanobacteria bacterium SBC]